jgi:hypothetical protein
MSNQPRATGERATTQIIEISTDEDEELQPINDLLTSISKQVGDGVAGYTVSIGVDEEYEAAVQELIAASPVVDNERVAIVVHPQNQRPTDPNNRNRPSLPGGFSPGIPSPGDTRSGTIDGSEGGR